MERSKKNWGIKTVLFINDLCEVSILELEAMKRCSWHSHRAKWNQFYVIVGSIQILTEDGDCRVDKGQIFTINPTQWHEFRTPYGKAVVQEIMYVRYEPEDINRKIIGGDIDNE